MNDSCGNCKFKDEFGFCDKLVIDTRRCLIEDGKYIKAYYVSEREETDDRTAFLVPLNFKCNFHELKKEP